MENKLPKRKSTRLQGVDYNSMGAYFITVCVENRNCILSQIVEIARSSNEVANDSQKRAEIMKINVGTGVPDDPQICVKLTEYGRIADKYINRLNNFYDNLSVDNYVIMPNHIHILLRVNEDGTSTSTVQNSIVSRFLSTFKRYCNKEYGKNIWQYRSNDHIIRDRDDYERHVRYICENPKNWMYDELYGE